MRHGTPDRVPVMCQLALGHYFLHAGGDAVDDLARHGEAFADALRAHCSGATASTASW